MLETLNNAFCCTTGVKTQSYNRTWLSRRQSSFLSVNSSNHFYYTVKNLTKYSRINWQRNQDFQCSYLNNKEPDGKALLNKQESSHFHSPDFCILFLKRIITAIVSMVHVMLLSGNTATQGVILHGISL